MFEKIKLPYNGNNIWKYCLLIIIVVKVSTFLFLISQQYHTRIEGTFARCGGDCPSYMEPIDNLLNTGSYTPRFRLPGYGIFYLPLSILFSTPIALNLLVIIQLIIDICAAFVLIKTLFILTKKVSSIYLGLLFYGIGITITTYTNHILTESITASLLVFCIYGLVRYLDEQKVKWLLVTSFFGVWVYFCRPIFLPIFILTFLFIVYLSYRKRSFKSILFFLIPFFVIQGSWNVFNLAQGGKSFFLVETPYNTDYKENILVTWEFIKGFDDFKAPYFFSDADYPNRTSKIVDVNTVEFPDNIYTEDFNRDSLIELREMAAFLVNEKSLETEVHPYDQVYTEKMKRYTVSLKKNHPFMYYIETPIKRTFNHVFKSSGVQFLYDSSFDSLSAPKKLIKLFFVFIYLIATYGAVLFIFYTFLLKRTDLYLLFSIFALYSFCITPSFIIGTSDVRYLYPFYPIISVCAVLFYIDILKIIRERLLKTSGNITVTQ